MGNSSGSTVDDLQAVEMHLSVLLVLRLRTGELSLEEFVAGARSDSEFMEVMMKSLDLSHIMAMIHNRRHSV